MAPEPHSCYAGSGRRYGEKSLQQPVIQTAGECEAAVDRCLSQMQRVREQLDRDQTEIDRLKGETREILARLKAA